MVENLQIKKENLNLFQKLNNKPITSELGNVTPIIVHPGKWSTSDIKYQAKKNCYCQIE